MRLTRLATAAAGLTLALGTAACFDDGITGINDNPNGPPSAQPQVLFPQGVTSAVNLARGSAFDLTFTGLWSQYYSKVQYVDEDWYQIRPQTINAYWDSFYAGALKDLQTVIRSAEDQEGILGPALVMRAWTVGIMTDTWGDIPFTEALKGEESLGGSQTAFIPVYDPQAVVYDSILTSLAEAGSMLAGAGAGYGSADPIYRGDVEKWRRFANSLRARYGMRLSKVDPARAEAEVKAAIAAGVFQSNADNAVLVYPGDGQNDHPFYTFHVSRDDHRISKAITDTLLHLNDPRVSAYAAETDAYAEEGEGDPYVGLPNGLSTADAADYAGNGIANTSRIGPWFIDQSAPAYLMTYAEVLFIQAEAAARGWIAGDPGDFYRRGIEASMRQFGVTSQAEIDAYLAQPRVAYSASNGLTQIALQKWIALFGQGIEGWSEWRRTGVPNLTPVPEAKTADGSVARRLQYPTSEQSFNKANLDVAVSRQGGATMTDRVWWDKP